MRVALLLAILFLLGAGCGSSASEDAAAASATTINSDELLARMAAHDAPLIVDVRTQQEYDQGHIEGSIVIPHDQMAERYAEQGWQPDQEIVLYCRTGRRVGIAKQVLEEAGFTRLRHLEGDITGWKEKGLPLVTR